MTHDRTQTESTVDKDTKQIILEATVELIREEGFGCATLRKIASRANTNLALVNYYFGSKDQLLSDAMRMLISTFDEVFAALEDPAMGPKERLKHFFVALLGKVQQYPGLVRKMMDQTQHIIGSHTEYSRYWKVMRVQQMHAVLTEITGETEESRLSTMLVQLYGAAIFSLTLSSCPNTDEGEKLPLGFTLLSVTEQIDELIERYFYQYK
ncbi:TetR/AcrR family transcriptional regulator [Paenibacillus donghaensis]|uniref:HTH tetR-type domain-containing protein n=1 Tax=Paenibacillus donghaensis TaxID=414771 RepID=A0A2Z2KC99_9BACL|nr:TetR/AcrR family transcriptional regulator [Paenibacillus donghaensis]ASA21345.1 hypothetical protein B9T62_11445 [Paenibacillus donghaensis]